jgi:intracellular septation protein
MADIAEHKNRRRMGPGLKMATEVGPLVVFFAANFLSHRFFGNPQEENIFYATGIFMAAILASLIVSISIERRLPVMPLVTGVLVLIMGGLTLYLQDELFIKLKPTIVNTMFAVALMTGLAFGQLFLKYVFGGAFKLNETGWRILTVRWSCFFLFLALVNEVVWRTQTTDFWVTFKVWGIMPMTMAFAIWQMRIVTRYPETPREANDGNSPT